MNAIVNSAMSVEWPLNTVIAQAGIQADNLGVIGWIDKGGAKIYIPIYVLAKGKSSRPSHSMIAILRSTVDLERVEWRLWPKGMSGKQPAWIVLGGNVPTAVRAGDPIKLQIAAASQRVDLEITTTGRLRLRCW
jgi:hypothetical protein